MVRHGVQNLHDNSNTIKLTGEDHETCIPCETTNVTDENLNDFAKKTNATQQHKLPCMLYIVLKNNFSNISSTTMSHSQSNCITLLTYCMYM